MTELPDDFKPDSNSPPNSFVNPTNIENVQIGQFNNALKFAMYNLGETKEYKQLVSREYDAGGKNQNSKVVRLIKSMASLYLKSEVNIDLGKHPVSFVINGEERHISKNSELKSALDEMREEVKIIATESYIPPAYDEQKEWPGEGLDLDSCDALDRLENKIVDIIDNTKQQYFPRAIAPYLV